MSFQPDQQFLHYRLVEKIGEGGMGVVWKAQDMTLSRDVAIKFLPDAVAGDPERLARFDREARLLASLNHPNIASVYGLHETDEEPAKVRFIAMEHVPGEDLAERLSRGAMPVDDALETAIKIARGMSAAHESGTIHRDLKPANVRITPTGEVKVLDFGLARASDFAGGVDSSISPTITYEGTQAGVLLGTAPYMSPEQARGRAVDRRADAWAFGCLLYECLTGTRAFPGDTISDILAEIIKGDPDWTRLPENTPPAVRRLLRRCLAKDPDERLRDLGDAALELTEADAPELEAETNATTVEPRSRGRSRALALSGVLVALAVGIVLGATLLRTDTTEPPAAKASVPATAGIVSLPDTATIAYGAAPIGYDSPMLDVSADGRYVVYVGRDGDDSRLYRHDLQTFASPEPIPGTEGALHAFFSPKEAAVGFVTNDKLARVDVNGDRLQLLGDVRAATRAIWGDDGWIYVGDAQGRMVWRFPESGGDGEYVGEVAYHGLSEVLPGGAAVLFHDVEASLSRDFGTIELFDVDTKESRVILENAYDARVRGDRIFFIRGSALLTAPFDSKLGEVIGEPEILVRDVAVDSIFGQAQFALSQSGTLVYLPGTDRSMGVIAWVDRDGRRGTLPVEPRVYGTLDVDPTDTRIAVHVGDVRDYIWIYDLERQEGRKLPANAATGWPVWNSAGTSVTYVEMTGAHPIVEQKVDSRETPRVIFDSEEFVFASSWSPDDTLVAVRTEWTQVMDRNGEYVGEQVEGAFMAEFSPDGRWIAHGTRQAGVYETIVRSWPDGDRVYSIQTDGGVEATWSQDGQLFYRLGDRFYVMETTSGETFTWTSPELAFEIPFLDTPGQSYDVTSDGQRMYTIVQAEDDIVDRIHVIGGLIDHD